MLHKFDLRGQQFLLRRAHSSDQAALLKLINHAFRSQDKYKGAPRISAEELAKKIATHVFFVVEDSDDRAVACIYYDDIDEHTSEFGLLAVNDTPLHNVRGLGIGRFLISYCEQLAHASGHQVMAIEILDFRTELLGYYAQFGYQPAGFGRDFGWAKTIKLIKKLS